jgi:hypothetical protein
VKAPFTFSYRRVIDACVSHPHESMFVEFPVFVTITAKPVSAIIMPLVGKPDGDPVLPAKCLNANSSGLAGFDDREVDLRLTDRVDVVRPGVERHVLHDFDDLRVRVAGRLDCRKVIARNVAAPPGKWR